METKLSFQVVDLLQVLGEIILKKGDPWLHWRLILPELLPCWLLISKQWEKVLDHELAVVRLIQRNVFVLVLLNTRL